MIKFKYINKIFIVIYISISGLTFAQNKTIDSLKLKYQNLTHDTSRFSLLIELGNRFENIYPDTAIVYHSKAKLIAQKMGDSIKTEIAFMQLSNDFSFLGNLNRALQLNDSAFKLLEKLFKTSNKNSFTQIKKLIASNTFNTGIIYTDQARFIKALDCYYIALKLNEELTDSLANASVYMHIGIVHRNLGAYVKALEYYEKSLNIHVKSKNLKGIASSLINIGNINIYLKNYDEAIEKYREAKNIHTKIGLKRGVATGLYNIGVVYEKKGDYVSATNYFFQALQKFDSLHDKKSLAFVSSNLSANYFRSKDFTKCKKYGDYALKLAEEINLPEIVKDQHRTYYDLYNTTKQFKLALFHYENYIALKDSMLNAETTKQTIKKELKFQYEKQAAADSVAHAKESEIKNVQLQKQGAEIKAKKNQQYALFGGLGLVIIFAGFMYNRFKITQKQKIVIETQKEIVEEQKKLVEEKQKEVLDSIRYAKRIQTAHLPNEKIIAKNLERLKK